VDTFKRIIGNKNLLEMGNSGVRIVNFATLKDIIVKEYNIPML
jgi:hypothetical protein